MAISGIPKEELSVWGKLGYQDMSWSFIIFLSKIFTEVLLAKRHQSVDYWHRCAWTIHRTKGRQGTGSEAYFEASMKSRKIKNAQRQLCTHMKLVGAGERKLLWLSTNSVFSTTDALNEVSSLIITTVLWHRHYSRWETWDWKWLHKDLQWMSLIEVCVFQHDFLYSQWQLTEKYELLIIISSIKYHYYTSL
jgi:hypothetical protein